MSATATKKYAMVHDDNLCIGCQACSVACRNQNEVPEKVYRLQVWIEGPKGKAPHFTMDFHRQSCVMCSNPPCVPVCPTGASFISPEGITLVDGNKCVGCKYCLPACPYLARYTNPVTGNADKCTFCWESRVGQGLDPACVSICPTSALTFGDMNDPKSPLHSVMAKSRTKQPKAHLMTEPKLHIIPNKKGAETL